MIIREKYLNRMITTKDTEFIKVITGVRRSGKSTLMLMFKEYLLNNGINEENIIHINFESALYDDIKNYKDLYEYVKENIKTQKDIINIMKIDPLFAPESDVQNDMRRLTDYLTYMAEHFFLVKNVKDLQDVGRETSSSNSASANAHKEQSKKEKRDTIEEFVNFFESNIEKLSSRWIVDEEISKLSNLLENRLERKKAIDNEIKVLERTFLEVTLVTLFVSSILAFLTLVEADRCRAFFHIADTIVWREEK